MQPISKRIDEIVFSTYNPIAVSHSDVGLYSSIFFYQVDLLSRVLRIDKLKKFIILPSYEYGTFFVVVLHIFTGLHGRL